jgi:hypothetical protein
MTHVGNVGQHLHGTADSLFAQGSGGLRWLLPTNHSALDRGRQGRRQEKKEGEWPPRLHN